MKRLLSPLQSFDHTTAHSSSVQGAGAVGTSLGKHAISILQWHFMRMGGALAVPQKRGE